MQHHTIDHTFTFDYLYIYLQLQLWNIYSEAAAVLKNFANVTGKYMCWSLKPAGCNSIKKRLLHRCFLVRFEKFLRTPILKKGDRKIAPPPEDFPTTDSPLVRVWVRVRVGGNLPRGILLGRNIPSTLKNICEWLLRCIDYFIIIYWFLQFTKIHIFHFYK